MTSVPEITFPAENKAMVDLGFVATFDPQHIYDQSKELVREWQPRSQVFMLSWGPLICATAAGVMVPPLFKSMRIGSYLLKPKVKRSLHTGMLETGTNIHYYVSKGFAVGASMGVTCVSQDFYSLTSVFANDPPCAPCRQLRAVGIQVAAGWLWTSIVTLVGVNYVVRQETMSSPHQKGQLLSWARQMAKRNKNFLLGALAAHALVAAAVNFGQEYQWYQVNLELLQRIEDEKRRQEERGKK